MWFLLFYGVGFLIFFNGELIYVLRMVEKIRSMAVDVCILARILEEWARLFHFSKLSNWED